MKVGKGEERSGEPLAANHFSPGIGALSPILGFGRVRDRSCSFGHARTTRIKVAAVYLSPTASACIVRQHRRSVPSPRRLLVLISRIGFIRLDAGRLEKCSLFLSLSLVPTIFLSRFNSRYGHECSVFFI